MSLLPFWALNMSVVLLSMQGQKALRFNQKYLNLCSEDEQRSYRFGTTFHFWVNCRFKFQAISYIAQRGQLFVIATQAIARRIIPRLTVVCSF